MNQTFNRRVSRLVRRILTGNVVFFIGAGFSIDSEGNTAQRLVSFLLVRFMAIILYLEGETWDLSQPKEEDRIREDARALFQTGFCKTFDINCDLNEPIRIFNVDVINVLAREYYRFNDWVISAYGDLLAMLKTLANGQDPTAIANEISSTERYFLALLGEKHPDVLQPMPLKEIFKLYESDDSHGTGDLGGDSGGKVLFLETLGFGNEEIMTGDTAVDSLEILDKFKHRIRERHLVLARLAREGLCPTILTTNYDLLIEGGLKLIGLHSIDRKKAPTNIAPMTYDVYTRIAEAGHFFRHGSAQRSALVVKIHGCAETYRHAKRERRTWLAYLQSIVFTYREIQNWRRDMWSRDLLQTLLRTKTIAFCGYSTADQVIHNTFRNVYEEMAKQRSKVNFGHASKPKDAPVFFMDVAGKREFHGLEILRAANQAIGTNAGDLTDHPNLISFEVQPGKFPNLDDVMSWILHVTYRQRQLQVLESELRLVAHQLLGHPPPPEDIESIKNALVKIFNNECCNERDWTSEADSRRKFRQIISWTNWFHPAFLRELACAEFIQRNEGPGLVISELRHDKWYCPILDHPDWTAWGVVLEVALRRTLAARRGKAESWADIREEIRPGFGLHPTIVFFQDLKNPFPQALTLFVEAHEPPWYRPKVLGAFQRQWSWRLTFRDLPWPIQPGRASQIDDCPVPSACRLWKLATGEIPEGPHLSFDKYFGENHETQSQTA